MLIDSHCHLDFPDLAQELPAVLQRMRAGGVGAALCVGVNLDDWPRLLAIVEGEANLFASVGVHPDYADAREASADELAALADHPKVIAIGETGLDYHWHKDAPAWQRARFACHIAAARKAGKPLIVHTRDAAADTMSMLAGEGAAEVGGIMHCFTEGEEVAAQALDLGFHISFSGIVTFKNAAKIRRVAQNMPLDRLLVETDAPFLAPEPLRGQRNEPANVRYVAEEIARLRGISPAELAEASSANFCRLFPSTSQILAN